MFFFAVGNPQLRGTSDQDASLILQWINFGDNEILPSACTWVYPCLGIVQYNKQVLKSYEFNLIKRIYCTQSPTQNLLPHKLFIYM